MELYLGACAKVAHGAATRTAARALATESRQCGDVSGPGGRAFGGSGSRGLREPGGFRDPEESETWGFFWGDHGESATREIGVTRVQGQGTGSLGDHEGPETLGVRGHGVLGDPRR